MTVERSVPEVGYLDPEFLRGAGVSQTVRVNDTYYMSGIVAATGTGEAVAPGDMAGQIRFVMDILGRLLGREGLDFSHVVATTVYCRDIEELKRHGGILAEAFRAHPPTSTWVQVGAFTSPDYLIEIAVTAVRA